jgi:hypothetical protein
MWYLRTYMEDIIHQCRTKHGNPGEDNPLMVCGQNFDTDGYNIVMRACDPSTPTPRQN